MCASVHKQAAGPRHFYLARSVLRILTWRRETVALRPKIEHAKDCVGKARKYVEVPSLQQKQQGLSLYFYKRTQLCKQIYQSHQNVGHRRYSSVVGSVHTRVKQDNVWLFPLTLRSYVTLSKSFLFPVTQFPQM